MSGVAVSPDEMAVPSLIIIPQISMVEKTIPALCFAQQDSSVVPCSSTDPGLLVSTTNSPSSDNFLTDLSRLSSLIGDHPHDAFEPVPIGGIRARTNPLPSSSLQQNVHLESILDNALNAVTRTSSPLANADIREEASSRLTTTKPFNDHLITEDDDFQLVDDLPPTGAADILEPTPITRTSNPALLELSSFVHEDEPDPPSSSNGRRQAPSWTLSVAPMAKRRRISSSDGRRGGQPRIRGYQERQWTAQFKELIKFKEQKGHCLVPHNHPENQVLSRWVKRQRYQYKLKMAGKVSTMTQDRIKKLEDIGFVWDSHASTWHKRLKELKEYRDKYGDCNVPPNYPENPELATWIKCQRRQYKLFWRSSKSSSMTSERMSALDELGFIWKFREESC